MKSLYISSLIVTVFVLLFVGVAAHQPVGEDKCVICEWIVHELEVVIGDNYTEAHIWEAVAHVCKFLPTTVQNECEDFVEDFGEKIVQLLIDTETPDVVCQQIGLCQAFNKTQDIWSFCGTEADHLKIESVVINPDPPYIGSDVNVVVAGTLDEEVTGGAAHFTVSYFGVQILDLSEDICKFEPEKLPCPFAAGPFKLEYGPISVPSITPPGLYAGEIALKDQNNELITCLKFEVNMKRK